MTGQALLDRMELLDQELQLQTGEADVTRGLLALNVAQDYFESVAAQRGKLFGSSNPVGTVSTAANTESTAFPSGLLRIDRLQYIDPTTNRPAWDLDPLHRAGGHAMNQYWLMSLMANSTSGRPTAYYTNGSSIYWSPLPDATYTVRYYGLVSASDITASGTFAYPDIVALPIAAFATRLFKGGLDDQVTELSALAVEAFTQTLDTLGNAQRDGATPLEYTDVHTV